MVILREFDRAKIRRNTATITGVESPLTKQPKTALVTTIRLREPVQELSIPQGWYQTVTRGVFLIVYRMHLSWNILAWASLRYIHTDAQFNSTSMPIWNVPRIPTMISICHMRMRISHLEIEVNTYGHLYGYPFQYSEWVSEGNEYDIQVAAYTGTIRSA